MTQRTKVAFLIRDLGYGGAQRQLAALASGLDPQHYDVTVVSFYGGPQAEDLTARSIRIITIGKKHRWDMIGFLIRTVRTLRGIRPDLLHTYLNESNLLGALIKSLLPGVRLIWGLRDSQTDAALYGWLGKLVFWLGIKLSRTPDFHIANSHSGAAYYGGLGYPAHRIHVVPNGIDVGRFKRETSMRQALRDQWRVPTDAFLFGAVGRLSPMKDHATALHALAALPPSAHLLIMGNGSDEYRSSLVQIANDLKISARVHWSPARDDMPQIYSALDALVSSSAYGEGFSNVIGEAMACGVPAVGTRVGDTALLIGDPLLTATPGDPGSLSAAMSRVMSHPPEDPRSRITENFTIGRMVQTTADLFARPKPTTIAIYTTGLGSGGAEMMLTHICSQLDRSKFTPVVISLTEGGKHVSTLQNLNIQVHSLGMKAGKPTLGSLLRLRKLAGSIKPDLHVGWMYHGNLAATLASWLGRSAPVIWNIRQSLYDLSLEKRGSAMVIKLLARISWQPKHIVYNSKISAQQHEAISYSASRTRLTANGFNIDTFHPSEDARTSLRAELGLGNNAIIIGRLGRNAPMKDFTTFLAAAALVSSLRPDIHFIVAGTDTEQLPSQSNVHLLGERHDIPRRTAALDVACSSSAFGEGFPNVVAEAMASGVPVVATDVGDSAWLLGSAGKIVPSRDPEALAAALLEIIQLPADERHSLGCSARQRIVADFSLPAVVRSFEQLLDSTLHPPVPQPQTQEPCVA